MPRADGISDAHELNLLVRFEKWVEARYRTTSVSLKDKEFRVHLAEPLETVVIQLAKPGSPKGPLASDIRILIGA